jgi:hypothetical protein
MLGLKRKDDESLLTESECSGVSFSFKSAQDATKWQAAVKKANVVMESTTPVTKHSQSYVKLIETINKIQRRQSSSRSLVHSLDFQNPADKASDIDSMANLLVIPAAGNSIEAIEGIKLNILSNIN